MARTMERSSAAREPDPSLAAGRVPALDVMRGAAMLVVLAVHGPEIPAGAWGRSLDVLCNRGGSGNLPHLAQRAGAKSMRHKVTHQNFVT